MYSIRLYTLFVYANISRPWVVGSTSTKECITTCTAHELWMSSHSVAGLDYMLNTDTPTNDATARMRHDLWATHATRVRCHSAACRTWISGVKLADWPNGVSMTGIRNKRPQKHMARTIKARCKRLVTVHNICVQNCAKNIIRMLKVN